MRLFKAQYTDRQGRKCKSQKWYIDFTDHLGRRHRLPAFENKRQSEALGRQIQDLIGCRVARQRPDAEQQRWLESVPDRLRQRFVKIGLLDSKRAAAGKSLTKHLEDFEKSLLGKGNTPEYVAIVLSRVSRVFDECKFTFWNDIQASKIQHTISQLHKHIRTVETKVVSGQKVKTPKLKDAGQISAQTYNFYIKAVKQFCKWMVQDGRASESPVDHLQTINVAADRRHDRRALEADEIRRLLEKTRKVPERFGMSGHARALVYRLVVETGLRAKECKSLKVCSFDFKERTVTVISKHTKNRKEAVLPLRPDTAAELKSFLTGKLPNVRAFNLPYKTADMLKADLKAANIPYVDSAGRYADFHSLRHSTGSLLAASGAHPKVVQSIMRHSDINLTMSRYTHIFRGQESEAVAGLPDLSLPSKEANKAKGTGTDDNSVFAICLDRLGTENQNEPETTGKSNLDSEPKTPFSTANGRIRTDNHWFTKPETKTAKGKTNKGLTESQESVFAASLANVMQKYPEIEQVITAWPTLPDEVKEKVIALVKKYSISQKPL